MKSGSLYIHVPFCTRKCHYCHFFVTRDSERGQQQFMEAIRAEWEQKAPLLDGVELVSVYFGGGTPALLGPDRIHELLSWIPRAADCEITLEANPENLSSELVSRFAAAGVNRLSIGIQSTDTAQLHQLGRQHTGSTALRAVESAAAGGIANLSVDLMFDLPGQTLAEWRRTLTEVSQLPITHLSLYNMTIEPESAFFRWKRPLTLPSEEESAAMLSEAVEEVERWGLRRYEISAFAREGCASRHNLGYWQGRPFLGLGPSAFSYWEGARFRNVANLQNWSEAVMAGNPAVDFSEKLEAESSQRELIAIGLRVLKGVDLNRFGELPPSLEADLSSAQQEGWIESFAGRNYRLTERGRLFYDELAAALV